MKVFGCVLLLLAGTWAASPSLLGQVKIDPSQGSIHGQVAISFWPSTDSADAELLFPAGFTLHLVPSGEPDRELVEPCGVWFQPPPGKYRYWLEGPNLISPYSLFVTFRGGPFTGKGGVSVSPVVGAGRVILDAAVPVSEQISLRLLSVKSHQRGDFLHRELARRVAAEAVAEGVQMPEGEVVAALYDLVEREYLALSPATPVLPGAVTKVAPRPPAAGTSALVVVLERPALQGTKPDQDVQIEAVDPLGSVQPPDLLIPSTARVFAFWLDLDSKRVTLNVRSPEVYLEPVDIALRPGKVEQFRGELRRLPSLDVLLELPEGLAGQPRGLSVRRHADQGLVANDTLKKNERQHRFEHLPPTDLEVLLDADPWLLIERVDLSDGEDQQVLFKPEPIEISGTVYRGSKRHPARVGFGTFREPGDRAEVSTDESGDYEISLFRSGRYSVYIDLEGAVGPPYTDYILEGIFESQTLDFHVPATEFRVRVIDEETGRGIEGATVTAANKFEDEGGSPRTASQPATTDSGGIATLQPLRPGQVIVEAKAEGYRRSEPVIEPVMGKSDQRDITIRLEKALRTSTLRLLKAEGWPAAGADLQVRVDLGNSPPLWEGTTGRAGQVEVPSFADGAYVLVRHPGSGSMVRVWRAESQVSEWILPPAGPSVQVRVEHAWGDPAAWADLALWLDGYRVHGEALAWLSGTGVASTNRQGIWASSRLPAQPMKLLAWSSDVRMRGFTGAFDGLATSVGPPFSQPITIQLVE